MNNNAPFIREIVDRTRQIQGVRVQGNTKNQIKQSALLILQQQRQQAKEHNN